MKIVLIVVGAVIGALFGILFAVCITVVRAEECMRDMKRLVCGDFDYKETDSYLENKKREE